ncbi:DEAD/DEAH box helicase [Streptomyces sp. NBC_01262]|uniref:DEAD/DEAH box helicase n=1 Tax=Streptomyces sp. NBC_01262 TaxID=2903803 RepID=UPI002E3733AD|nr:Helicase associated domain protein [Streptomyces sp. NBC_01262]
MPNALLTPGLWPHQRDAVNAIVDELACAERVTAVLACGTGKTRIAGETARLLAPAEPVLIVAPFLELIAQTIREWRQAFGDAALGRIIAVCSDQDVVDSPPGLNAELQAERALVTSDPARLADLVRDARGRVTVACTYHSLGVITAAQDDHGLAPFALAIADEAHRTAGSADKQWAAIHDNARISARRRLNLTATPKMITPGDRTISMLDEKIYGKTAFRLSFATAIELGLLAGYQTVVPVVTDEQVRAAAAAVRGNPQFLRVGNTALSPAMLATQLAVLRAAHTHGLRRMITFHNKVANAKWFAATLPHAVALLGPEERPQRVWAGHVHGGQPLAQRRKVLDRLRADDDSFTVVSNARVLGEGIDVPAVDSVAFIDPRRSAIDTVQAVGRALRLGKRSGPKTASILVPVHLGPGQDPEAALEASAYAPVWQVVRGLAAHDDDLATHLAAQRRSLGLSDNYPEDSRELPDWLRITGVPVPPGFAAAITVRAIRSTTETWNEFLGGAAAFKAEHGHLLIPDAYITSTGFRLGQRMRQERLRYKDGILYPGRKAALDELGAVWDVLEYKRQRTLAGLRTFKQAHGHLLVPRGHLVTGVDPFNLGSAVSNLRTRYAVGQLTPGYVAELNDLGMVWNSNDEFWDQFTADLTTYRQTFGNLDVSSDYLTPDTEPRKLGQHILRVRRSRESGQLDDDKIDYLDGIGFVWNSLEYRYQLHLKALRAFRAEHGHVAVPQKYITPPPNELKLGHWLSRQKQEFRKGLTTSARAKELTELGVPLAAPHTTRRS